MHLHKCKFPKLCKLMPLAVHNTFFFLLLGQYLWVYFKGIPLGRYPLDSTKKMCYLCNQMSCRLQPPPPHQHKDRLLHCRCASSISIRNHTRRSTESTLSRKSSYLLNKSYKKLKKILLHVMKLFLPSTEDDSSTPTSILMSRINPASGEDEGLAA